MRKTLANPFTSSYPHLDVHGETRESAVILVQDFINDNYKLKNKFITVIHGFGTGILKKTIHTYLRTNKKTINFYLNSDNLGETIIEIDLT